MPQIETIMLVVLGLVVLLLGILLLGRGILTVRSGKKPRRSHKHEPSTVSEIQAERDRLRVEYAVNSRKQEIQISSLKTKLTEHMAEVSRSTNKIDALNADLAARENEIAERDAELAGFREVVTPLETELTSRTSSVQRLKEELREKSNELERLVSENAGLKQREAKKDIAISRLEQRVAEDSRQTTLLREVARHVPAEELEEAVPEQGATKRATGKKAIAQKPAARTLRTAKGRKAANKPSSGAPKPEPAAASAAPARSKRQKILSLAKRIRTLQEEAES